MLRTVAVALVHPALPDARAASRGVGKLELRRPLCPHECMPNGRRPVAARRSYREDPALTLPDGDHAYPD